MFVYIQSLLFVLLEILCCKIFFEIFGSKKAEHQTWKNSIIILLLIVSVYFIAMLLAKYFFLKESVIIIVTAVFMIVYLEISFWKSLILSTLFQGLLLVVDYFAFLLNATIFSGVLEIQNTYQIQNSLIIILGKVILFLIVLLIRKYISRNSSAVLLDTEWLRFVFFPIFTICTITAMISSSDGIENQSQENMFFIIAFGLAGTNIVVFYLINDILKREMKIHEDNIFRLQVQNQASMYFSVSENFNTQRKKTHEYKNQIMCIESLIKRKKYNELEQYIEEINGRLSNEFEFINTNNVIVNAIINTKYQEISSKNIVFVFRINDLSQIGISNEDMVVILANLLNNAIEACEKCQNKKIIKLKLMRETDLLIISVKNTYETKVIYKEGEFQTTKKEDADEHGIGIKNIVETIGKYGGRHAIQNKDGEFYFSIIIPQEKK